MTKNTQKTYTSALSEWSKSCVEAALPDLLSLIDLSITDTNKGTHYSTKEEFETVRNDLHTNILCADRSLYGCLFCIEGITDFSKQQAVINLLANPREEQEETFLTLKQEAKIIDKLVLDLPSNRMLNLFNSFRESRINNARTRTIILTKILNSGRLELWSVKYRRKLRRSLEHAWGTRRTGILRRILSKATLDQKEKKIIFDLINKHIEGDYFKYIRVQECISFILGNSTYRGNPFTLANLKAFVDSKIDITKGKTLPLEVLEGIRSTYHPTVNKEEVIKLVHESMTDKQKKLIQKRVMNLDITIDLDFRKYNIVDLFLYAFEMGWSEEIGKAINFKAKKIASTFPIRYHSVGILIDDSFSMSGSENQKLRPMAISLALSSVIAHISDNQFYATVSGRKYTPEDNPLLFPKGHTSIGMPLINLLEHNPDTIFILSDGYENVPSGRVAEIMEAVRNIGIKTPVSLLNPVSAFETKGVRSLGIHIETMPVSGPQSLVSAMFKKILKTEPLKGLQFLINSALFPVTEKTTQRQQPDNKLPGILAKET